MDNKLTLRDIATFFIGVLIGIAVTMVSSPYLNTAPAVVDPIYTSDTVDQYFIEQMIPHHEGAVAMAMLALDKAEHPQLKTFVSTIISTQGQEINTMRSWYSTWYKKEIPVDQTVHSMESMSGNTSTLTDAENFDVEFLNQMIVHHESAIMMAKMIQKATAREELKTLAKNIIESQTTEIEQMRNWRDSWK
jgi:uncharacterized protein (DUF305 family)